MWLVLVGIAITAVLAALGAMFIAVVEAMSSFYGDDKMSLAATQQLDVG